MHGAVRLMSTSNRRILTYVVFWSLVNSVCVFSQVLNKDFGIQLYEKNLTWLTCPEGWSKVGSTCVLVLAELATFTQADSLCQSNGGRLLRVEGFNQNQQYGTLIENVQYQQRDQFLSLGGWDGNSFWIGMYRDGGGQYHWADGQVTKEEQGFWTLDQPLGFQQGHKLCSSIDVKHVSDFGKYRWSLRPCEEKLPIVCQTVTCAEQQYRCQGDSKCISADWLCDGIADCLDQSDERNCSGYCGNTYQGQQGTFQSPNYPHHYPSSSSCQWNIHTPLGTRVYLEFDDFNLENNYDVVSIYDGHSTLDPLVGNFSGGRLPIIPISSSNSLLVQFHSDQDNQSTGFNATWFAVDIQGCGGSLNATSQNQWLTSPGYNSGQYVHNLLCDWILSAPQDLITLQFEDISLRAGDWVEVRDGSTEDAPLFGRYTGDTLTPVIISTGQHLFVRFTSDEESIGKGFNASFKAGCNDIMINKEAAIISSPGYKLGSSFSYPPNLQCSWHLSNPTHTEVAIIFDDNFDTEVDFDVLTIINSSSVQETGAMMQRFSGTKAPPVLRSLKGHFNISFTSDDLVSRPGWRAVISPDCPALHNLSDSMHISSMEREYGTVVKFTCDTGYLLEGATNLICDIKGTWSNSPPVCKKINCGSPSVPENGGIVTSNSSYYTGVVVYRCDVGYHSGDDLISRCQKNGQWSSAPKCEKITCPKIGNLQNGSITTDFDNTFGQKVSFQCNGNYRLVNASEIICGEDGQWSTLKPHCAPPLCPYLPIANGNTSVLQPEGGSWVQVHCKPGYRLLGSQRVWCNLDGTYQSNIPTCADVNECEDKDLCYPHMCQNMMGSYKCRCSHGYQKLNETSNECIDVDECERPGICHHHCNNTEGSYVCECDPGYKLYQGGEAIVVDQRVIIPNKTCIVTCPAFNVSNGGRIFANTTKLSDESYIYPTSLFIYCPYGTLPLWNATTVFCQANGTWSHNIDHCTDQVCEALESPVNGMVYYDSPVLQLGTIATYNCSEGYVLLGTPQRQCMSNGRATLWESGLSNSNFTYCRPRMCVMPAKPLNGFVNYTDLSVGSTATYSCKCGYELIGSKVIHCQGNGVWSGNGTICVDKDCSTPIPPTNGGVYSSTRMYYFGSRISYTCQKGYSLIGSPDSTCSLPEQTSPPELLLLLFVTFKGDNNINDGCASQYRTQMAAKFNESVRRLPSCAVLGMYVLDSSRENSVSGSQITIGTSINLSGSPSAMCNCSEDIVRSTPSSMNWEIIVDSCPTLANKNTPEKKFQERVQDWKCPTDFILEGGAGDCAYNETPICRKATDCLDSEDPNEITSTISTSKLPLSSQATSTISSTSPDASHWTESTSSVASVVTQSTLGNILSTLSTTHTPQQGTTASNSDTNSPGISDHTADIPTITTPSEATQITTPKSEQQTTTQLHSTTVTNKATDFTVMKTDSLLSTSDAATTTKATTMAKVSTTSTSSVTESMVTEEPTSGTTSLEPSEATSTAIKTSSTVAPTVDEISSTIEALATEKTSTTTEKTTTTTSKVQTPTMEVSTIAPVGTEKTTVKSPMTTKDTTVTTNVPYSVAETTSKGQTTVTLRTLSEAETSSTTTGSEFTSKSMTSSELPTTEITAGTSISTYSTEPQSATTEPSTVTRVALPTTTTNQPTPTTQPPSTTTQMKSTTALSINDTTQAHITTSELSGTTTQYRTPTTQSLLNSTVTEEQMTTQMLTEESTQSVPPQTATAVSETTTKQTESTITEIQTTPTQTTTTNLETTPTTDSTTTTAKATITTPQVTTTVDQGTTSEAKTTISQFDTTTVTQVSNTQPKVTFLRSTTTQPQTTTLESQVTTTTTQFTNAQNEASTSQPQTTTTDQQTTTTTTQAGITQPLATTTNAYKTTAEPQMTTTTTQFTTTQHEATTTTSQTTTTTKQSSTTQLQPSSSDQQTTSLTTLATTTESQATTTEPKIATTITQADATTTPKPQTTTTTNQSTTLNPQTTSMEKLTSTTRIQATTTQQDTTTTEQQITTRSQSTILPQTYTTEPQPTMTNRETTTTEKQTITTTSQPLTELPQTTTTKRHTTSTEQQTTTTVQSTTENLETSTTQQQIAPTTTQSTTTQKPTTSTEQLTTTTDKPESTTIEQQTTTTTTQSSTRQPEITTTKLLTAATEKPETSTTEQQTTTTQSTTTQPQLNTMLQTSTTDQQTTTTTPQFTTQLHTTSTVTPSITQPQTTTTEQHTTTTTTESTMQPQTTTIIQSTTQPQATISKHKTTSTTPQSTTQSQTTTTEQQTTTKTTQSTTQPQTTTSEQQTTTTTPQSTTQPKTTTTEQQTTITTTQLTTQPQTTTTEQQTTTTRTQSTTQPQTTTTTTQSTTQPQTTTEPQTTTTEALIAETTTPGTTLASSMYPLHYGTYWTYTHPANEDTSCQQEMATAYQTAFDESKVAIENAVKSQKKSICPSDIILTITYDRPPIFDPSQEFVFVLKIGFTGNKSTMEKCAAQVNSTINSKVESLFDFNPLPCPSVYPLTDRTLSKRSEWICSSQAYRYDTNQHMCVLRLSSAASFVATRLSDQELDVVTEMIPQIPPTTNVQPHLYSTTTTTTSTTTTTTYVPSSTRTPVEPDQTPFFVNEVFFKFQAYNLTENCLDTLKQNFQNSVDQASSAIRMVLPQLSSCQHITDAELINRKSTFSHDTMSPLNQMVPTPNEMILTVPFILRTRKYPHHDMESCINASIKSLLEVGFVTNISNLIKAIPRSMCHRIELIETRYTMDIQCPSPYRYDHSAKRCYTVPLLYMPTRFYLMEITLSLTSRGGTQCNTSYSRSIRRQLETQNVSMLKNGLYDICLMYNVVVKINPKMSNLTRFEEGVRGIVGIVLMATSENPNYNECVGSELYKYIFSTDLVPGTQIIPTDNPRECGNLTWEENQVIGMVDNTCLGGYFKFEPLNRCIEERSAELRANYTPNIAWKSTPSHDCLSSLAHQMENFMNIAINATRSSANCSQMYQIVRSRPDPINNSVNLELSILPFQWDENGSIACLRENNKQLIREQFNQDNATSCPLYQGNISINIKSFDFKCIRSNYYWNKTTRSCVKGLKRKKRSRAWQKSPTKSQSLGEGGELGKRGRQKRSVAQNPGEEEVASWLPEAPLCQDHQPPVFNACPEVLNISMGRLGPIPFDFSLPQATDNSGVPPSLSYSPADIVRQPYLLKNETQIVITAKDQSNNIKNCTIQLSQVDDIPPDMTCPDSVVVEKYSTLSNQTNITLSNWATAWDYSGIHNNRISYQIGYNLPVRHFTNVTATANDTLGNRGSCHFLYEAKRADLNADGNVALNFSYSLERPSATCKNKTFTLISNDVLSIANNSCIISAELYLGYQFELRAQKVEQSFMYTVQVLLKRTNKGKVDKQDSFELNLHVIQLNVHKEKFHQCMDNFTQQMIDKYQSGYDLRDSGCGEVNISLAASKSAIICPHDSVLNESTVTCSQCDLGYYANQTSQSCQRCPSLESEIIIHGDCKLCNSNLNTVSCLKPCQPGEYSENGLQPCVRCPRGQYTPNTGARVCEHCQEGHYTEKTGALQCKAKCPAGQYSDTGLHPCRNCPWNHYSSTEMSTACSPCPIGQVTDAPGKSSITDCQEIDFCASNPSPCQNGGTCQRKLSDNWYSCDCPSGYHGYHCENRYNVCDSEPCLNGATCIDQSNRPVCQCPTGYTGDFCEVPMSPCSCVHGHCRANADGYYCSCFTGYAGPNCSEDIDECSPNPCLHGGRCMNLIGQYQCDCSETGYDGVNCTIPGSEVSQTVCFNWGVYIEASKSCSCRQGYSGAHCQNLVDECQDNFCGENGDCIDEINNFTCVCKPGFTGRYCNINISECSASPCRNGTCIPGNNNFSCVCQAGFEGKQCEINRDECSPFPCNLTTAIDCRDGVNDYTCVCREGYTGKWCQNRSHSCPVQCQNGGSCNGEALRCDCLAGYTGPYCEVELNECAGQPCLNGGTCTDRINSFNCSCPLGYTGATCDVNINECSSNPCQNGGTCLDLVNRFICSCPSSFTGSDCSQKISLCSSLPCENGAECMDSKLHGYLCSCPSGYNGQNCSDIVTCDSSPCHNGGSCTQEENNFTCSCALGFTGRTCDTPQDPCLLGNVCRNGASCVNGTCLCTPFFTGFDCGKVKSSDFDLFFHGLNGSFSSLWISVEQEMSVCLWIRPFNTRKNKSVLTLAVNDTATGKVLEVKERNYSVTYPPKTWYGSFPLNNGLWNHVCFTWTQTNFWSLYLNGSIIRRDKDMLLPNRVMILLGQPLTSEPGQTQFYGEISQLQVFPKQLTENDISSLSKSCNSATESHNSWLELLANIMGDVRVIEPSACGGQRCPAGYKGHNCSIKVDKNPPVVHGCPSDFRVVSSNRLNKVNWTEPTFSDDVGVVNVYQTHRSGEVMAYGEYSVKYWAFDSANNTANCSFRVAVTPFDCEIPEVPAGVTHSCQRGGDGSYCRLSCTDPDTHAFSESVPQFYKCGLSGLWDPPRGENFTFPACAAFSPPAAGVTGTISFTGPLCTNNLKDRLVLIFNQTMAKWNQEYGLCPDQVCNLMVRIHCSGDITLRRRRRQAPDTSYLVRFNFPVNKTSLETTSLQPLDSIKTYVKKGEFNTDGFVAKNDSVIVTTQCNCLDGQILQQVGTTEHCVNCAMGSFHNKNESTCDLCPVGFYNDQERQTACTSCPEGQTTQDPGAQHISQCYTICPAGQYAEDVTNVCKKCPRGYYQELTGRRMCQSCPSGLMTLQEGATTLEQCQAGCLEGQELSVWGNCVPCQQGFYKGQSSLASCQACPYGTTTSTTGSTSIDKCYIVVCAAGSYKSDNQCFPCPLGQYQPQRGQSQCLQCPVGQTTLLEGSVRPSDCVEGNVNECLTNVAKCGPNEDCKDTLESYRCDCKEGYTQQENGNCTVLEEKTPISTQRDDKTWTIVGSTVGAGLVVLVIVVIILILHCRKDENECLQHEAELYRQNQVVVLPMRPAPVFSNRTFASSRSSSLSLQGSDLEMSPAEMDLLPPSWPDEPLNISDSSENGSTEGAPSSSSGFDVNSDSYF